MMDQGKCSYLYLYNRKHGCVMWREIYEVVGELRMRKIKGTLYTGLGDRREDNEKAEEDNSIMSVLRSRGREKLQSGTYGADLPAVQKQTDSEL